MAALLNNTRPAFIGVSLINVDERIRWKSAMPLHILHKMNSANGFPLHPWKIEEQLIPMSLTIHELSLRGIETPQDITDHLVPGQFSNDMSE